MLFYFCLTCVNSLTEIMSYDWFINLPIQIQRRTSCLLIFFSSTTAHKNKTNTNTLSSVCNYFLLRPNVERHYDNVSILLLSFEYFDVFYFFRRKKKRERQREKKTKWWWWWIWIHQWWYIIHTIKHLYFSSLFLPVFINDLSSSSLFFEIIHIRGGECTTKEF